MLFSVYVNLTKDSVSWFFRQPFDGSVLLPLAVRNGNLAYTGT
jgi:hypothetical protein